METLALQGSERIFALRKKGKKCIMILGESPTERYQSLFIYKYNYYGKVVKPWQ